MKPLKPSVLTAALLLCLSAVTPAQVIQRPRATAPPSSNTGAPACTASDQVEATALSIDPAQPSPGQAATLRLTVKSKCPSGTKPLAIQWEITDSGDRKLANGDAQLNPGASSTFTAAWTAAAGTHTFRGDAYAEENTAGTQNNGRAVEVTVQPKLVTQALDYEKAKQAGANFSNNVEGTTPCDVSQSGRNDLTGENGPRIIFRAVCHAVFLGGRGTPEVFKNFRLKNGWKVKGYEVVSNKKDRGDWEWRQTPQTGSDEVYMKMHVWADAGGTGLAVVKVVIEGPEGTNPYQ